MTAVIHVITALERGGAQRVVLEIAARLHHEGRPQLVIAGPRVDKSGTLDDEAEARLGNRLLRLRDLQGPVHPVRDAAAIFSLAQTLDHIVDREHSPVVVHTHSSKAGVIGRLAARALRGVLSVHTVHGFGLDALGAQHRWILEAAERASSLTDIAVFVSESDREHAQQLGLFRGARTELVRAGVDVKAFAGVRDDPARIARGRALAPRNSAAPLVVTVANLKAQKDPLFHVEVLAALRARVPGARLLFLGDGPLPSGCPALSTTRATRSPAPTRSCSRRRGRACPAPSSRPRPRASQAWCATPATRAISRGPRAWSRCR
jgi:glycosyltransferase involved in cell wall biosynthesis